MKSVSGERVISSLITRDMCVCVLRGRRHTIPSARVIQANLHPPWPVS